MGIENWRKNKEKGYIDKTKPTCLPAAKDAVTSIGDISNETYEYFSELYVQAHKAGLTRKECNNEMNWLLIDSSSAKNISHIGVRSAADLAKVLADARQSSRKVIAYTRHRDNTTDHVPELDRITGEFFF